jgi:hypothetical protein
MESTMKPTSDWRSVIKVHPAAEMFPEIEQDELAELTEDIKTNGLRSPVTTWRDKDGTEWMLDGRNRLDAMAAAGYCFKLHAQWRPHQPRDREQFKIVPPKGARPYLIHVTHYFGDDPYAYVVSANIHRRHLTTEQRKDIAAEILKRQPDRSDRSVAKETKLSPSTVGEVRKEVEGTVQTGQLETEPAAKRVGRDGKARKQPKKATQPKGQAEKIRALLDEKGVSTITDLWAAPLEPGCCTFHDTGGDLGISCGKCDMGGTRQPAPGRRLYGLPCSGETDAASDLDSIKYILRHWWTNAGEADRLALGQWFDELRMQPQEHVGEPTQADAAD